MSTAHGRPSAPADLRRLNTSHILEYLRDHGPAARSEIADATGLVRGSITGLVNLLGAQKMVREVDESLSRGRPAPKLAVDGAHRAVLVAELMVDRVTVVVCDLAERPLYEGKAQHRGPRSDPNHILGVVADLVRTGLAAAAARNAAVERAVLVVAAPVDEATGHVPISVDLDWADVDVRGLLLAQVPDLGRLTVVADGRVGGWAEYQHLRREQPDLLDMVYLKSDTGIGGLHITDGRVLRGAHDLAFTPGHMSVDASGPPCSCGQRGCLVTVAGPEAVAAAAGLTDLLDARGQTAVENELLVRAGAGDPRTLAALDDAGAWLGRFINLLYIAADPGAVVLGGYWSRAFDYLAPGIRRTVNPFPAVISGIYEASAIRPAALGDRANILGAADTAIREIFAEGVRSRQA